MEKRVIEAREANHKCLPLEGLCFSLLLCPGRFWQTSWLLHRRARPFGVRTLRLWHSPACLLFQPPGFGGLIRQHPLSSDFPTFFTSDSLGAFTQIHYWVPAPLTDPDIFREPVWPAQEVSLHWPKGSQDNPDSWLSQLSLHLEWPYVTPFWPVRHQRKSVEVWGECSGKHSTS